MLRVVVSIALLASSLHAQDVLLVVLDDVAAVDLALYGGPIRTPVLEALAREGVLFTDAYANPTCSPSRRSLFTGHWWTAESGDPCQDVPQAETPPLAELFLPELLPQHESALFGKWHVGSSPSGGPWECAPVEQGFGAWLAGSAANVESCGGLDYTRWTRVQDCRASLSGTYEPVAVTNSVIGFWRNTPAPRLAVVCSNLCHVPFHRPPPELLPPNYPPTSTRRARFEAMMVAQDTLLGEILAEVDLATTLVIVVGDNGTPVSAAPDPTRAKGTTYQRGIRVPLVIAGGPVLGSPRVSGELVHLIDLWRTAIEWGGGSARSTSRTPFPITARSLLPLLRGRAHKPRPYLISGTGWTEPGGDRCILSSERLKLRQLDDDGDGRADREELYDLRRDPDELVDRSADPAFGPRLALLREVLRARALP